MPVAQLVANRQFRVAEQILPNPLPGQVQVKVEAVGICGSDLHYFSEGHIGDTECVYPMVLGHEPVGVITGLGDGVSGWSVGDRVALEAGIYCYHCEMCMSGRHNLCSDGSFMSSPTEPGFFRDRVNLPALNLLPMPKNLGFDDATLFEPISIILHSMRFIQLGVGETAAIFGAGPIGLTTLVALRLAGASRIWVIEPLAYRRELALAMGADAVIDPRAVDPVKQVLSDTGQRGVDVGIDCASREDTINQTLQLTRSGGRSVITGVPSEVRYPIEFHTIRKKELQFHTVRRSNHTGAPALKMLSDHLSRFAPMVSHRRTMTDIQPTFEMIEKYDDQVSKAVVHPAG